MTRASRQKWIAGVTILTLAWPLAHLALVTRAGVDPWEFFAWAMYSQPPARVQVRVEVERAGEMGPLRAMGELREAQIRYAQARSRLGTLASPDAFVARVFASDPTIDVVTIVLRRVRLDRETAMLVGEESASRIVRPSP